jgi:4-amino-4-deoxy-L-arabinose transferase-like glycosyltransferase
MQNNARHLSLIIALVLGLASLFPLIAAYNSSPFLNDDSYITLTYAKNLALGRGFVFNHPPATLGTTTPLFTIVVASLARVFSPAAIQYIAVFLTAFCWLGIVWVLYSSREAWGLTDWQVGIVGLVIIGSGWVGFLGMEAYLFAFLLVLSLSLFLVRRFLLAGFVTGLLFLTRGEGALVLVAILGAVMLTPWRKGKLIDVQAGRIILRIAFGFAVPVALWLVYAHLTFGSFLPNTLAAKQAQGQAGVSLWRPFWQLLTDDWMPGWGEAFALTGVPLVNLWWVIVFVGLVGMLRKWHRWLILVGWIGFYVGGYVLLNVPAYQWYQLPILFVLNLLFGLGVVELVSLLVSRVKPRWLSLGASVLVTGLLLGVLAKPTVAAMLASKGDARGESYVALSQWLRDHTQETESIAFIEVGYLGYYTDNRIVDLTGLTLPDIVPHIAEKDFAWGFWHYQPDYYIYLPDFDWALASIRMDARFDRQYQPVATLPGPRRTDFVIYKRVGN